MKLVAFILVLSLSLNAGAVAPSTIAVKKDAEPPTKEESKRGLRLGLEELISPVTTDAAPYFWYGSALTGILAIFEDDIADPIQEEVSENKPLGKTSKVGDLTGQWIPNAAYMVGMYTHYLFSKREKLKNRAKHMLKSSGYASVFTLVLKTAIQAPRPDKDGRGSFPSGHTSSAFAFAGVVAMEHEWYWSIPAFTLASFTAFSRINDNRHYLHDVIGGAVIGLSYAMGIYYLHNPKKPQQVTYISPLDRGAMLNLIATF